MSREGRRVSEVGGLPCLAAPARPEPTALLSTPHSGNPSADGKAERGFWVSHFPVRESHRS